MPDEDNILRRCQTCKVKKSLADFHRHAGLPHGRQYRCKACLAVKARTPEHRAAQREYGRQRYARACEIFHQIKSQPCMDCGGTFPHYVMEFDHPDRSIKTGNISQMIGGGSYANMRKVLAEVEKAQLVCANCHRIRTHQQMERGEWPIGRPRIGAPEPSQQADFGASS